MSQNGLLINSILFNLNQLVLFIYLQRANKEISEEALKLTADLLHTSSDFYSVWNYRKTLILGFKEKYLNTSKCNEASLSKDDSKGEVKDKAEENKEKLDGIEQFNKLCLRELELIEGCLRKQPKSYATWFQRMFVIQLMPHPDLKKELEHCDMLLKLDGRNCEFKLTTKLYFCFNILLLLGA